MDTTTVLAELIDTTCGETSCDAVDSTESSIQADRNCKDVIEGSQLFILPTDDLLKQMKVDEAVKSILDKENVTFADFEINYKKTFLIWETWTITLALLNFCTPSISKCC